MPASDIHRTIDALWRQEAPQLIARLARMVRDVGVAEDLAQDALVAALEQWPTTGLPQNPGAWLMATAKHRATDHLRRSKLVDRKHQQIGQERGSASVDPVEALDPMLDDDVGDDLLRLIFTACHPLLSVEARAALALRLLCGLTTDEIARAFLVPEPTIAQRIVRAKGTLAEAQVPFEVPRGAARAERMDSVLGVIYLFFNEGYSATVGDDWMRPELSKEALRLGRVLADLAPDDAEVHGLVALMEIQQSRARAREGPAGEPILLMEQDRTRWDQGLIRRGLTALQRADELSQARGPYALQAALAACHARARTPESTDWVEIARLYGELCQTAGSPVVELNRAVAIGMAYGPEAALVLIDRLKDDPALRNYHLLPGVRADLLMKMGRLQEARGEFECAAALTRNARERDLLLKRADACG